MATDAPTLLAESKCDLCYSGNEYELLLIKLGLLRQLVLTLNPMADTSAQTLLALAKCYQCYASSPYMLQLIELALLKHISTLSGGGGGGAIPGILWIYWEASHADDNAPADPTFSYMRRFLNGDPPVIWNPDLSQWL